MSPQILVLLGQDGLTNGAIYALLALAIVLVFTVTRVLFIPLGEFVAFGALTLAALQAGKPSAVVWLLAGLSWGCVATDVAVHVRDGRWAGTIRSLAFQAFYPLLMLALVYGLPLATLPQTLQVLLTLALLVPMGPMLYRLVIQPMAHAPVLVLLIASMALHLALVGVGLLVFGPDGAQTAAFTDGALQLGFVPLRWQTLWVLAVSLGLIVLLYLLFGHTLIGKALRAAAMNRVGARLMGISPVLAGKTTFALATGIAVLCGILISPVTTLYYDSGFLLSLKGFVGAIIGALVSYPVAAAGALLVGLIESFSAFWASAYKEVIVFTLIIPVLLWRSLTTRHVEEEE